MDYESYPKLFYVQCRLTYFLILADIAELINIDSLINRQITEGVVLSLTT